LVHRERARGKIKGFGCLEKKGGHSGNASLVPWVELGKKSEQGKGGRGPCGKQCHYCSGNGVSLKTGCWTRRKSGTPMNQDKRTWRNLNPWGGKGRRTGDAFATNKPSCTRTGGAGNGRTPNSWDWGAGRREKWGREFGRTFGGGGVMVAGRKLGLAWRAPLPEGRIIIEKERA